MATHSYHDDDDDGPRNKVAGAPLKDFDCPACNANNPCDEVVGKRGIEIRCNYCGVEFKVTVDDSGRFKFKDI